MKLKREAIIGIIFGVLVIGSSFLFILVESLKNLSIFYFMIGTGVLVILLPFVIISISETRNLQEKDEMFLEFSRNLVESFSSGTSISKSIINMSSKNFGSLSPHIQKLANQIQLGIPLQTALQTFAYDSGSNTIIRAITLIREADKTGGDINSILDSVANSVAEVEKLKAERRSAISSIVMEGYIIFLIFIVIMVVMEVQIIPMTSQISGISVSGGLGEITSTQTEKAPEFSEFSIAFLALLLTQGFFAGLIIGKLAEGDIKAGIKHSFIMVAMAILISTGAKLFF